MGKDPRAGKFMYFGYMSSCYCHTCHKLWTKICEIRQNFKGDLTKICKIFVNITLELP